MTKGKITFLRPLVSFLLLVISLYGFLRNLQPVRVHG